MDFSPILNYQKESLARILDNIKDKKELKVGEALGLLQCSKCQGSGTMYVSNGEDDVNAEMCEQCNGQGWVDGLGFPERIPDACEQPILRHKYLGTDL